MPRIAPSEPEREIIGKIRSLLTQQHKPMRYLCAELTIDGNLLKGVVVDVLPNGEAEVVGPLSEMRCEPEATTYVERLIVKNGKVN